MCFIHASPPIWASSNNHSPKICKILLHFGRAAASGGRDSMKPKDGSANLAMDGNAKKKTIKKLTDIRNRVKRIGRKKYKKKSEKHKKYLKIKKETNENIYKCIRLSTNISNSMMMGARMLVLMGERRFCCLLIQ